MRRMMLVMPLLLAVSASAQVVNGSFESGDVEGWWVDMNSQLSAQVVTAGTPGLFGLASQPTDGGHSLLLDIDGAGVGLGVLRQDLAIQAGQAVLMLDFVAQWDLSEAPSWTGDVEFSAMLWGESGWLNEWWIFQAVGGTTSLATDRVTAAVDLSKFAGKQRTLDLFWDANSAFTGQAAFELDDIHFVGRKVPTLQRSRLAITLDFAQEHEDRLLLDLVVAVPPAFAPEGESLVVQVGGVQREFTLDAAGASTSEADSVRLFAVSQDTEHRRLKLSCRDADLGADLESQGLVDMDTGAAGVTVALPVTVVVGGEATTRELRAVYKAAAGVSGKALARGGPETWRSSLSAKLNLEIADEDSMHVRTAALVPAGFTPKGQEVRVDVGGWSKTFTLDADGKAESTLGTEGVDRLRLDRDPQNAERQVVRLTCLQGNLGDVSDDFFNFFGGTGPGGAEIHVPVTVTVDGRALRSIVVIRYFATASSGTAHS